MGVFYLVIAGRFTGAGGTHCEGTPAHVLQTLAAPLPVVNFTEKKPG